METAVIIRARNEERWLGETLRRLEVQSYKDFEIIVVDSGSTDRTLDIVKSFPTESTVFGKSYLEPMCLPSLMH